jgi:trigger factor
MSEENTTPVEGNEPEDDFSEFGITIEDAGTLKKKITLTVGRDRIDAQHDEMYGDLMVSAQIPGFRPGRAPRRLLEKRFGEEVAVDVRNSLISQAIGAVDEAGDVQTIGQPDLNLDEIELPETGDLTFSFEVEVAPEFDLPTTDAIAVDKPALEVTDQQVEDYLERFRGSAAKFEESEGPAAEGDLTVVDAVFTADDCDDVARTDVPARVGPGQLEGLAIVDMGEKLAGVKVGDVVTVSADAGESHPHEPWHGKTVSAALTVKQITARQLPDIDDDFATQMGFDNVDEMKSFVRSQLEGQLVGETTRAMRTQVCDYLLKNTTFDLPEGLVARHAQVAFQRRYISLLQQGAPREAIEENLTHLQAEAATQAQQELRMTFILGKVADNMDIEVGEDEVNARVTQMAIQNGTRPEKMRQEFANDGTLDHMFTALREEKAVDKLLETATVTDVTSEEFQAKHMPQDEAAEEKKTEKKAAKKTAKKTVKKTAKKADAADGEKTEKKTEKKAAKKTVKKTTKKTAKKADASADNKDEDAGK